MNTIFSAPWGISGGEARTGTGTKDREADAQKSGKASQAGDESCEGLARGIDVVFFIHVLHDLTCKFCARDAKHKVDERSRLKTSSLNGF